MAKYGSGTPTTGSSATCTGRYSWQGVGADADPEPRRCSAPSAQPCLGCADGVDPSWDTGIINGVGHYWGYRNFRAPDAAPTCSLGHHHRRRSHNNNHHTYPTSARASVKPYEFDIGWMYIA